MIYMYMYVYVYLRETDGKRHIMLYCIVLCCTALYCTVLYCTVLYCTALHCPVLHCNVLYYIVFIHFYSVTTALVFTLMHSSRPTVHFSAVSRCSVFSSHRKSSI